MTCFDEVVIEMGYKVSRKVHGCWRIPDRVTWVVGAWSEVGSC